MMYHSNRLIKAYERVGYQTKPNDLGVGVVGVIECNWLQPTHNKQDFDYTKQYRACISALGSKLNDYWNEKKQGATRSYQSAPANAQIPLDRPDQSWVQCDRCLKWRKLPDTVHADSLLEKWFCEMNTDPVYRYLVVKLLLGYQFEKLVIP
ncbi:MORC family CW-type zinc finger protein 3-like [Saccoglossus kowalevskii]|uniref:MORC family CW-type zinc finger protein 3-like n=1 Tax=Saccoglossus kowalevskii TaxID=10224 RepID=A0ABM0M3Q0_SACKO|nr:PREDICTED: MORC family CW-type zinc finger protein 3-like [Saccoglossus kowalevskii]